MQNFNLNLRETRKILYTQPLPIINTVGQKEVLHRLKHH